MSKEMDQRLDAYGTTAESKLAIGRPGRWIGYAAAISGAGVGTADAAIFYSGLQNIILDRTNFVYPIDLDLDGIINEFTVRFIDVPAGLFPRRVDVYFSVRLDGSGFAVTPPGATGPYYYARKFGYLDPVGTYYAPPASFRTDPPGGPSLNAFLFRGDTSNGQMGGAWSPDETAYVGIVTDQNQFGWIRIATSGSGSVPDFVQIIDWAFETEPLTPIPAGLDAIPEPSSLRLASLGLLALGAAGVLHYRKNKAATA